MSGYELRELGRTGLKVTALGSGGVPVGDPAAATPEAQAQATLQAAWDAGIRFFDTAPWYGNTKSEHRIGHFLRQQPRSDYVLSTKVGRLYRRAADPERFFHVRWAGGLAFEPRFDSGYDGIMRAYEDSLMRLGLARVDALATHDLDFKHQKTEEVVRQRSDELERGGGFKALAELKAAGEVRAIGAGINHTGMVPRFLDRFPMDYFLVAMPYTLLDQEALDVEFPLCAERGVGIVIGAVFASGVLATGVRKGALYRYLPLEAEVADRVKRMQAVCARHDVPLAAAALQFPLAHPIVAAVIPGADAPEQVRQNAGLMQQPIPAELWADLKCEGLLRQDAPVPGE